MLKKILVGVGIVALLGVLLAGIFWVQSVMTNYAVEQEWQTTRVEKITDLGTTRTLEILPLFEEARARDDLTLEHGVSYLIKTDHGNFLFDVGMTPAQFSHNLQALKVSAKDFDTLVITHIHPDHIGGVDAWWNNRIVAGEPSLALVGKRVLVPLPVNNADMETTVVTQPMKLAEGVASIGAIAFPELFPLSIKAQRNAEQALAVNVAGKGIVLITGCGHPTVERLVARAQMTFDEPIVGIVGGLHYEGLTAEQVQPHIAFMKKLNLELVSLSPHDSSVQAIREFQKAFAWEYQELMVGQTILFPDDFAPPTGALPY